MDLNQITVPSKDLEVAVPFYQKLGLKLIVKAFPHYARYQCPVGNATFSIHLVDSLPKGEGVYVYFECDDIDQKMAMLIQQGFTFDEMPTDKKWLWREARLRDPDGNRIILFYGGENRLNPPWRINPDQN